MDIDAEREKITKEIKELERILDPRSSTINLEVSESSLESDSDADLPPDEDSDGAAAPISEEERWGEASNDEDDPRDKALPEDPETCLQLNMVYQEVVQEKLAEIGLLLAQNREQQEEVMWDLAGSKGPKVKDGKSLSPKLYIGHFMKPYFKDKVTGVGPPANDDTREKAAQGIKAFKDLLVTKWKGWEKALLRKSVVSDRLQRLLQPKLLKLEYLEQKRSRGTSEVESAVLEKQSREAEREIQEINQLSEEALLGDRLDSHDWEKISNVNFEGGRSAQEIQKFWQNWEHPSINKQEWSDQEVDQLKAIAATHGHLEWQRVAEELGTGRSAFQCLQEYQRHNTALKRREWTQEEDRMLTQLVQEMRVGSHIPYRRIVYYMEGRDSVQLIYRWTKSLDPSLKRGSWAPEEDAKLLRAVAKYGEQDWFKIRAEVPGRSDAQCRDRYVRRLHSSLKKGRWNPKEEKKLTELIGKYGIGRWAKIASELPHRTGSQCLSKWKFMVQKQQRQGRRRRPPPGHPRWSSSSGDSSSSSGDSSSSSEDSDSDSDSDNPEAQKGVRALSSVEHAVPDVDLWVPARQSSDHLSGAAASPSAPKGSRTVQGGSRDPSGIRSAGLRATGYPRPVDTKPPSAGGPADEGGSRLLKVPLETVLRVLRANTAAGYRTLKEKLKLPGQAGSRRWPSPSGSTSARPRARRLHWGHALQRRLLDRRLLMAVSPWVGDVVLPCSPQRPVVLTRADSIRMRLQDACLSSTPVFTLFIQLFQIDTAGCMEVVRERKARLPTLPQAGAQAPSSAQNSSDRCPQNVPAREAAEGPSRSGSGALQARRAEPTPQAPCAPRPKPKTVSELLREKRLREARARRAAQGPVVLRPHLLVTSPVILQPPLLPASPGALAAGLAGSRPALPGVGAPAATSTSAPGSWASANKRPPILQALAIAPAPTLGPGQVPGSCHPRSLGHSQAPATCRKQGLPEAPPFLPAAPSPTPLPVQPLGPMLAPATPSSGLHTASSTPLPVTWLLTAQGGLLVTVSPSLTETQTGQGLANTDMEPGPPCRTDLTTLSTPPPAHTPAEVARAPEGPSSPGEAHVARETAPQADRPEAGPSQQPPHNGAGPGGTPASPSEPREPRVPLDIERQPPPQLGPEKGALDLGLLSQESETAVRAWLQGPRGVCVPSLRSPLPYQPPALGSLRVLSCLLLRKQALERRAAALEPLPGQLQRSPAYLLLKARFVAAFTLPALLATLPPQGVLTTLSAARASPESEDSDLGDQERSDGHRQPVEGAPDPGQGPVPSCLDDPDDLDVLRTRHARHVRKRRRLV